MRDVVVVGAGFIGSEVAATVHRRGCRVTIVEAAPVPLVRAIGEQMGAICARLHEREGVRLLCGRGVEAIEGRCRVSSVRLTDGTRLKADLVVVGVGAQPATEWLADSGLRLNDGVVCDETLATDAPGVYAAGDVARWPNRMFETEMRLEHWTTAAEQGVTAARNALSPATARRFETVPYLWSDWYQHRIQFVGVSTADEVCVAVGDADGESFLALYLLRNLIGRQATWAAGLQVARQG